MCGRVFLAGGNDIFRDLVEDAGVLAKETNIEDFLRVGQPQPFQLRIQARAFRSKVWYA